MSILITGNTYPVRDQMRSLGGRWDRMDKGWRFSTHAAANAAQAIVDAIAPKPAPKAVATIPDATPIPQPMANASGAIDPARAILAKILATLPPRALADALMARGLDEPAACVLAVHAGETINLGPCVAV